MTAQHPTRSDAVLVGIDIAKHRHEVLIAAPGRARRRRLTVLNTRAEFDRLVALRSAITTTTTHSSSATSPCSSTPIHGAAIEDAQRANAGAIHLARMAD